MKKETLFEYLRLKIRAILIGESTVNDKMQGICDLLRGEVPCYDWVGFYLLEESKAELILGPFAGAPTQHARIPVGKGICGQAASKRETFLVPDVSKEENYLSGSTSVKSEIVVPIFRDGRIVGELDIDSHQLSPFSIEDREFLEEICRDRFHCSPLPFTRHDHCGKEGTGKGHNYGNESGHEEISAAQFAVEPDAWLRVYGRIFRHSLQPGAVQNPGRNRPLYVSENEACIIRVYPVKNYLGLRRS